MFGPKNGTRMVLPPVLQPPTIRARSIVHTASGFPQNQQFFMVSSGRIFSVTCPASAPSNINKKHIQPSMIFPGICQIHETLKAPEK